MYKFDNSEALPGERSPLMSLILFIGALFVGFLVANTLAMLVSTPFFGGDLSNITLVLSDPLGNQGYSFGLLVLQGATALIGFVLIPLLYLYAVEKKDISFLDAESDTGLNLNQVVLTFVIMLSAIPLVSLLGEWNAKMVLPESMKGIETWMKDYEKKAQEITIALISVRTIAHIILSFVVVGMIAALGEELVFRGVLQNIFIKMLKNKHAAILLAAFIFSSFHLQFYGFLPRFVLGILLGYLYVWSGNFMVPVIGHFVNNSVTLLAVYTSNEESVEELINQDSNLPWYLVLLATVAMVSGLVVFKQKFEKH